MTWLIEMILRMLEREADWRCKTLTVVLGAYHCSHLQILLIAIGRHQ